MKISRLYLILMGLFAFVANGYSQEQGDNVSYGGATYVLTSDNLISNPGFEEGYTGWTDATSSAAELSSSYFSLIQSGGIDDSQYLVGTTNQGSSSAGSIGTGWSIEAGKTYYLSYHVKYLDAAATAGSEDYLRISLTNDKTSAEEPLILIGSTSVNGGGAWTQNAVCFTNTSYSYVVARFRWLSNRFGFDNFALHEASEVADNTALQALIEEAQQLYDETAEGATELMAAITTAQNFLDSSSAAEIRQAEEDLKGAIYDYMLLNATTDNPLDMTSNITNQSFEDNFEGWNNNGMQTQTNSVFTGKEGGIYIEKWVNRGSNVPNVDVSQQLTGLPNGAYVLTVATGNIQQVASGSTENNSSTPQTGVYIYAGDNQTAVDTLKDRSVSFAVFDGEVEVGYKAENATGNWVTCDNFRLFYLGFDVDVSKEYLASKIDVAKTLAEGKLQDVVRADLTTAINAAEQEYADEAATEESLAGVITQIENAIKEAEVSQAAYTELQNAIDEATELLGDGLGNDAASLSDAIDIANASAIDYTLTLEEINNATLELEKAIFVYRLANASGTAPTVTTNTNYARGSTMIFGRSTISGVIIGSLQEHGFCWSTSPEPTILDNRSTKYYSNSGYVYAIENLLPSTEYYIRAYALTAGYDVGYGDVIKVITLPKGTVSYTIQDNVTGDDRVRIGAAMESAVNYFNNLTSIKGLWLNVNFGSGTPTAEASYGGYMRFGPNASYQQTGTALHEMGHTIGVGTHSMWYGPSSPLRETGSRGLWLGDRTKKLMEFIDNDPNAYLTGDNTHMWPYGVNGANEDTGNEFLYMANALIHQALGEDGLPPTSGFATPAYSFEIADDTKYYIKSEEEQTGLLTSFIVPSATGVLMNRTMTPEEALANDSAAWQIDFNPANSYYTIKNVGTGRYFTYVSTGLNGIRTVSRETPSSSEYFHVMKGRVDVDLEPMTKRGYWIIHPESKSSPTCFYASSTATTLTSSFNIANSSTRQRWLLLTDNEVGQIELPTSIDAPEDVKDASSIKVYSNNMQVTVDNITAVSDITFYNLSGMAVATVKNVVSTYSHTLPKGVYLVKVKSVSEQVVKKVIVQ
ncbi:T9SS type A sorting domain-containing protein [Carboxylicivirga linearis]|uniref:T9SS type A sorting domain-containing protein n=1 Tax=Carboxylicivirga linearis TaxID=1628157 RepID=A0ABS5JXI2_9BACT|nr:T9SS type A sorting domain-containing protein [Carboxylicivirga linearis]MBS2099632.1 T9SS type A sorting domain-containing protein [Carboxylicivirga linearis]